MFDHEWINIDVNSSKQLVRLDTIYSIRHTLSLILDFFLVGIPILKKICNIFTYSNKLAAFLVPTTYVRINSFFCLNQYTLYKNNKYLV